MNPFMERKALVLLLVHCQEMVEWIASLGGWEIMWYTAKKKEANLFDCERGLDVFVDFDPLNGDTGTNVCEVVNIVNY